jgi:ABC-type dipeptide/oligopeptide/nickel transport system ATPase component
MTEELRLLKKPAANFEFTHSPLMNKIHIIQIEMDLFKKQAMERDLTDDFLKDLDFRVENERNLDIVISGDTGSGKSRIGMSVYFELWKRAKRLHGPDLKYSADNICFTRTEWLERVESLCRGDTVIFDEDDQARIGVGSMRQLSEQETIEKTLRQNQYNFIFCSPLIEQHVEHYILKAFDIDYGRSLNRALIYKKDETGLILPYGHIILARHEPENYEEKKKKFRKAVQARRLVERFQEYDKVASFMIDKFGAEKLKLRTQKSLIQRYFPRFVEEEIKEIMTSIELIKGKVKLDYDQF